MLIERADAIADVSASMVPLAKDYLAAPDPSLREGISGQLLAQAAAELQVATELFEIAASEQAGPPSLARNAAPPTGRQVRGETLRQAITSLEEVMALPVANGLGTPGKARRSPSRVGKSKRGAGPEDEGELNQAKDALKQAATVTLEAISQRVVEVGGDLTFNLVFRTEWAAVIQSAGLLSKDIGKLLDRVKEGAGELIQRAVTAAAKTILNVFDKILALLGKDVEDQARKQTQKWLEDIRKEGKIELFAQFVGKLFRVDKLEQELPTWMGKSKAKAEIIITTQTDVTALADKFTVLVGRINTIGDVIGLTKFIQAAFPQVLVIVTAIRVALLAILVYGGYDFIGYRQAKFLNLTKGVSEVIRENLGISA
jgi:hypothetical protein